MKKIFVENAQFENNMICIENAEFLHLAKVLRTNEGESFICLTGDEFEYHCKVVEIQKKRLFAKLVQKNLCQANPTSQIWLFQGLAKGEKMELITQKTTELGIWGLCPFESSFTIAKNNALRLDRLCKISQEACKQCGRSKPLELASCKKLLDIDFEKFDLVLFLWEKADPKNSLSLQIQNIAKAKNIAIIVGAEGGFSDQEAQLLLQKGALPIWLGNRILRTETASITTCGFVSLIKNN